MKSTQCGVSEYLLIRAMANTGLLGRSVFYVLPTDTVKNRYVQNRVDMSIKLTPYYKSLIQEDSPDSTLLKHVGRGALAFAGSNTPNPFTEFPADDLIIDEYDRCHQEHIHMAEERLSASEYRTRIYVSQPTTQGHGVASKMPKTTQSLWVQKHDCGHWLTQDFFKHVVEKRGEVYVIRDKNYSRDSGRDIMVICDKCGRPVDRFSDGEWADTNKADWKGRHISKLFSGNVPITEIMENFTEGLSNDSKMQRFYNGDLGLPYTAAGSRIDDKTLMDCMQQYTMPTSDEGPCVMGVDVGSVMHVRINRLLPDNKVKAVYIGHANTEEDVIALWRRYNVKAGVIDGLPETRMSKKLAFGLKTMFLCFYGGMSESVDARTKTMKVDRTQNMDAVKEMFMTQSIILPSNVMGMPEYAAHMQAPTRIFDEATNKYFWTEGSLPDHFYHAELYAMLARKFIMLVQSRNR